MTQKGFQLHQKALNPLKGAKMTLRTDISTIISSLAKLQTGDYLLILGEAD